MTRGIRISAFAYSKRFAADLQSAPPDVRQAVLEALRLLQANPQARSLRLHALVGMPKPSIWKIDVFANHAWQITFELSGTVAELKRLGTHKKIDRDPRWRMPGDHHEPHETPRKQSQAAQVRRSLALAAGNAGLVGQPVHDAPTAPRRADLGAQGCADAQG